MNKKLIMAAAALLALTTLAGCDVNPGGGSKDSDKYATVTFDLNYAGAPAAQTVQVEKGDYIDAPEEPVREGYYFNGWYETQDASGLEFDFYLTSIDEDITLYADWAAAYTVTFYLNKPEATDNEVYDTANVRVGDLVTKPANPKISRFEFAGWFKTSACAEGDEFSFSTPITENLSLYAKWQEPDWNVIKSAIDDYLSFVSIAYGVSVPKFPNSGYAYDDRYSNALVITAPEKCLTEYKPILEEAGYTVTTDDETGIVKAVNEYITLEMGEDESRGEETFRMLLKINGAGEGTTFSDIVYQIGTQQNFITIPAAAKALFTKFEVYRVKLTTGTPAVSAGLYFDPKPEDSTQTDEEYFNDKVKAFMNALGSSYNKGTFSNSPAKYFYDKAYLTMNQVEVFDSTTPLKIDLLCYSYAGQYGAGVSINKIDNDIFAAASASATWKTKASFELDLSDMTSSYAVNGKDFVVQYDVGEDESAYIEIDILGVKTAAAARTAMYNKIINALDAFEDWEPFVDSSNKFAFAYHYSLNASGAKKADAKLTLSYTGTGAVRTITGGQAIEVVLTPVDGDWNDKLVADYFKEQAMPNDNSALPAYTGEFVAMEAKEDDYGRYLDISLIYTKPTEALAYKDSLLETANGYSLVSSDAAKGEYTLVSASGNFQVELMIDEDSLEIVIVPFFDRELTYNAAAITEISNHIKARNDFEFPAAAFALLTATYTKAVYGSFFNVKSGLGYTSVTFVSNVASVGEGQDNPVEADATALINYFKSEGYSEGSNGSLKRRGKTIYIEVAKPTTDVPYYALEMAIVGGYSELLDDGHVVKITDTEFIADNGDAFLLNHVTSYIKGKYASMENSQLPSFYGTLADASACNGTTLSILTNLESYDIYYYYLVYEFASAEGLDALAAAYKTALKAANFKHGELALIQGNPEGYWNESSYEFVTVDVEENSINIKVFFIGEAHRAGAVDLTPEAQLKN